MRSNPDYALVDPATVRSLICANPWCTFVSNVPGTGLVASHYPVLVDDTQDDLVLLSHVGRPDEQRHELGRHELLAIVAGPHGYVSPGWYGRSPAVPTWNFVTVHAYGVPEVLGDEENLSVLARLVDRFESVLPRPYRLDITPQNAAYARAIVGGTVGFRLRVTRFEAKQKMSQDKPSEVRARVVEALREPGPYRNPRLAAQMAALCAEPADQTP